jgi:lauroyl/myristoyl acyltransferase
MNFFAVWACLTWLNGVDRLTRRGVKARRAADGFACLLLRHLNYRVVLWGLRGLYALPFCGRSLKKRATVAKANQRSILGPEGNVDYAGMALRRQVLEVAATRGQNKRVLAELARCTAQLNEVVQEIHRSGSPVVLAPLHMVSDVLAGMVGAGVSPGRTTVLVSSSVEVYEQAERQKVGLNLDYCSIHSDSREIAASLMTALTETSELKRNMMIFPDITPDFTHFTNKSDTAKLPCRLFDRPANLHSGIIRMARMLAAQTVPYFLYFDGQLKIHIYPPVAARDLKKQLPGIIEKSLRGRPQDWMLWHAHSLYFINE